MSNSDHIATVLASALAKLERCKATSLTLAGIANPTATLNGDEAAALLAALAQAEGKWDEPPDAPITPMEMHAVAANWNDTTQLANALDAGAYALAQAEQDRDRYKQRELNQRKRAQEEEDARWLAEREANRFKDERDVARNMLTPLSDARERAEARLAQAHEALRTICEMPSGSDMLILARRALASEEDA